MGSGVMSGVMVFIFNSEDSVELISGDRVKISQARGNNKWGQGYNKWGQG